MLHNWHDARIKMFLTACGLRFRMRERELFARGDYQPLAVSGSLAPHLIAFARQLAGKTLLVIAPRLTGSLSGNPWRLPVGAVWQDTVVVLPRNLAARRFRHLFTGDTVTAETGELTATIRAAQILRVCPVAMLWIDAESGI